MASVTRKHSATHAQPDLAERLEMALDAIGGAIWDLDLRTLEVSRSMPSENFLGYRVEEILPGIEWWRDRVHPEDLERSWQLLTNLPQEGVEAFSLVYRFRRVDGTWAVIEDKVKVKFDQDKPVRVVGVMRDISLQVMAEQTVRTAEARQRAWLTATAAHMWSATPDGRFLPASEQNWFQGSDMTGKLTSGDFSPLVHPDEWEWVSEKWQRSLKTGEMYDVEHRIPMKDGTYEWHNVRATPLYDEAGKITEWIGAVININQRKMVERDLVESERRFRALAEALPEPVFVVNELGEVTYTNTAFSTWSGYQPGEISGTNVLSLDGSAHHLIHPDDLQAATDATRDFIQRRAAGSIEYRFRRKLGDIRWIEQKLVPIPPRRGEQLSVLGVLVDIEDRKRAEKQLRERAEWAVEQQKWLVSVLESTPVPTLLVEVGTGRIIYENVAVQKLLRGVAGCDDWLGALKDFKGIDRNGRTMTYNECPIITAIEGRIVSGLEVHMSGPGGSADVIIDSERIPAAIGQPATVAICYRDVTRVREVEGELRRANEAKDRFMAVLSHELRTPLTPVLTTAQLLEDDANLPPDAREAAGMIRRNVELETRLIDDLLDQTRIARGKLKLERRMVDLGMILRNVITICEPDMRGRAIELHVELPAEPIMVSGDAARLSQSFWNLLKNAAKFTPERGRIELTARIEDKSPTKQVVVKLKDNGIGIPAHLLPRVFDAFTQGEHDVRRYGGLGLGLTIAKALIELHEGEIAVTSEGHQRGAEFIVKLKLGGENPQSVQDAPQGRPSTARRSLKVLVVEDHGDSARVMQRLLKKFGHDATVAGTVAAALAKLKNEKFDLLISDIGLPDGSGYDLMRQSASFRPPAIAVSGFGMDDDLARSKEVGFLEHLTKPIDATVLENAIRQASRAE